MYDYNLELEDFCYEAEHIEKVFKAIKDNVPLYFEQYISTKAGVILTTVDVSKLKEKYNVKSESPNVRTISKANSNLQEIKANYLKNFEKDIEEYEEMFDLETLSEYEEDPRGFKNDFKKDISMIRKTLQSKDKSLDQFKIKFNMCDPNKLLKVLTNIAQYVHEYPNSWDDYDYDYDAEYTFEDLANNLLEQAVFDTEGYGVDGVIGGGIKSYLAHKLAPEYFAHRSRESIWALWYLVDKKDFGCKENSEFLMILTDKVVTHQNFYYPYHLFSIYAYLIYKLLKSSYEQYDVEFPYGYRYVAVNDFLKFVSDSHIEEINDLSRNLREE